MCISLRVPKRYTWLLTCSVRPIPSTYVGMQSCMANDDVAACHLITWRCGGLNTSDLTQWSGPITRLASGLSLVCQKYPCTVRVITKSKICTVQCNWLMTSSACKTCKIWHITSSYITHAYTIPCVIVAWPKPKPLWSSEAPAYWVLPENSKRH